MWNLLKKVCRDTLTGADANTYDFAKVSGMFGIQCLFFAELWHLIDDGAFDPVQFATAFGLILGGACGSVLLKNKGGDMPTVPK